MAVRETLALTGDVTIGTLPGWLAKGEEFASQSELPAIVILDFAGVTDFDSSTVALMLEWRRRARALNRELRFINLPPNLFALTELYGLDDIVLACCSDATTMPAPDTDTLTRQ
jgi:phospholipid transport system transporter-binding protein